MPERLQKFLNRIKDWWQKFTTRQKAVMISSVTVVAVALVILGAVLTRPQYVTLKVASSAKEAQSVQNLLSGNKDITWKQSSDGMTFSVLKKDYGQASILLGTNNIDSDGYTIEDALKGSFTTTESDKKKTYQLYLENRYQSALKTLSNVSDAEINLYIPDDDGTIISDKKERSASVKLDLTGKMSKSQARGIARWMATTLGNKSTDNITIIDSDGNTLFSGNEEQSAAGAASENQEIRQSAENAMAEKVKSVLSGSDNLALYDNVAVGVNLSMDFSQESYQNYNYSVDDGKTQGYLSSQTVEKSTSKGGTAGTPGTDSNDDENYVIEDGSTSESSTSKTTSQYLPDEKITTHTNEQGAPDLKNSSISVVATNTITYSEDTLRKQGKLKKMTFDEFRARNSNRKSVKVSKKIVTAVSQATGIPESNISILAYEVPYFQYSKNQRSLTDYLQIIIALLVFALLGFIVFKSLRRNEEEAEEKEVTVDELMNKQTDEEQLEDIGFNDKSEARVLIEKFVDEKPEAVASLLRNWLNEDWS